MTNAMIPTVTQPRDFGEIEKIAGAMVKSGYFQDSRDVAQAIVKVLAGQELGFGPFASMTGIYVVKGKPSIGANLMAAAVKGSARYDYRVIEMTDAACEIAFFERSPRQEIGRSRFTIEDAKRAETQNVQKFPRNMLFARAMSNGVRWFTPDVFSGAAVYTPDELGAEVDQEGNVIAGSWKDAPKAPPTDKLPVPPVDESMKDALREMAETDAAHKAAAAPATQQTAPKLAQAPAAPAPANGKFHGPASLVEAGVAENMFSASNMANKLKLANMPHEDALKVARLYRAHRDTGKDADVAAIAALAGEQPA